MKKIKINKLPKGFHRMPDGSIMKDSDHKMKMATGGQPVLSGSPREAANLEAEKGETVVTDLDNNMIPEHYKIGGKKHSQGGTPLNLPPKSFIFSDHKSMSLNKEELQKFIPGSSKSKMTPAQVAGLKKFDISKENEILKDADSDKMAKATAERNIQAKLTKLGELAMIQESKKDFEGGIPEISLPFLNRNGITPEQVQMINAEIEQEGMMKKMVAAYGKETYQEGGQNQSYAPDSQEAFNQYGLSFSLPGYTAYQDVQGFKGDGRFGNAADNEEGFFKGFEGVYSDLDALKASLDKYGVNDINPEVKKFQTWFTNTHIPERANLIRDKVKEVRGYEMTEEEFNNLKSGLTTEFGFGTDKKGFGLDGKWGTVTSGRRVLDFDISALEEPVQKDPLQAEELTPYTPEGVNTPFYQQDMVSLAAKATDRANRYFGYTQRLQPFLADPTFLDPERELQANQEALATASQASALTGRGQNLAGNLSLMQGKLAANQANTLARYTNANAQIDNAFELQNKDAMNKVAQFNALQNRQQAIDTANVNQEYDNFRRQKRYDLANLYNNALTNRAETDLINDLFPQYNINPLTGGTGDFSGKGFVPGEDTSAFDAFRSSFQNYIGQGPKTLEEEKSKKYGGSTSKLDSLRKFMKGS